MLGMDRLSLACGQCATRAGNRYQLSPSSVQIACTKAWPLVKLQLPSLSWTSNPKIWALFYKGIFRVGQAVPKHGTARHVWPHLAHPMISKPITFTMPCQLLLIQISHSSEFCRPLDWSCKFKRHVTLRARNWTTLRLSNVYVYVQWSEGYHFLHRDRSWRDLSNLCPALPCFKIGPTGQAIPCTLHKDSLLLLKMNHIYDIYLFISIIDTHFWYPAQLGWLRPNPSWVFKGPGHAGMGLAHP